jgi:hypothetical protein
VVSFLLAFPPISYMHSSSPPLHATCPAHFILLTAHRKSKLVTKGRKKPRTCFKDSFTFFILCGIQVSASKLRISFFFLVPIDRLRGSNRIMPPPLPSSGFLINYTLISYHTVESHRFLRHTLLTCSCIWSEGPTIELSRGLQNFWFRAAILFLYVLLRLRRMLWLQRLVFVQIPEYYLE